MSIGYYSLAAIRGYQGKHTYYLIQCPMTLLARVFLFDETEVPAALRQGRLVEFSQVLDLKNYLLSHSDSYTLPPLVAVVDRDINFTPVTDDVSEIGHIHIPMNARLIIHDGQHRRAAIQDILAEYLTLTHDTIPIMLIPDPELERSSEMYTVLNRVKPPLAKSKQLLQDQSDLAILIRQLVDEVPLFQGLTELHKSTISNRSSALFTLNAVYQATQVFLKVDKDDVIRLDQTAVAKLFWTRLGEIIPEWQQAIQREVKSSYLRANYVHVHSVTLVAIGIAGHSVMVTHPDEWTERLHRLRDVDWSRKNTELWEGRAMIRGKMSKTNDSIKLTANAIKQALGLTLTEKEQELEAYLQKN
jgi:DNA sulfur modification protein DndB